MTGDLTKKPLTNWSKQLIFANSLVNFTKKLLGVDGPFSWKLLH